MTTRVLICAKGWPPDVGGVQTYSEFVARAYLARGIEPVAVSLFDGPRGWHERLYPEGAMRLWNVGTGPQPVSFARMLFACRRLLARERFDFVHPTTWRPAGAVAAWRGRRPMVLSVHGQEVLGPPSYLAPLMLRMLRRAEVVVAVSPTTLGAARTALGTTPRGHWLWAFNGLSYPDAAARHAPPAGDPARRVIYSFCRLAERKNVHGALRALALLRARGIDNFHYVVGGGGPMRAELEALIDTLGLRDRVTMLGYVEEADIPARYRACDIFLHPQTAPAGGNDLEGFGLAIADAMSFGALAIVGQAGGPADFVRDGETGCVVDGERIEAIADALALALTDPAALDRLRVAGRAWVLAHLSWDAHVGAILSALEATKQAP